MPWHTRNLIEAREAFVRFAESGDEYFSRLCQSFGISRPTGYKWLHRYQDAGQTQSSLVDRSRRPHRTNAIAGRVCQEILRLRQQHGWGASKLASALKVTGVAVSSTTVHRVLMKNGQIPSTDPKAAAWIRDVFVTGKLHPISHSDPGCAQESDGFEGHLKTDGPRDRKKAVAVMARLKAIPLHTVAESLHLTPRTIARYAALYASGGLDALFRVPKSKVDDSPHETAVFALLHSPPSASGINRTTWKMDDLQRVLKQNGHGLSQTRIRRIIKAGGYRWRRAKIVLTSNAPDYEAKLAAIKDILANLKSDEAFFSVDEYGPFAVRQKPGRKLVEPHSRYVVPQWEKSKGWMIMTAALELARNQVTHFYSRAKNTEEMIRMANLLCLQYKRCSKIYLSWDAASWHVSKKLMDHVERNNAQAFVGLFPFIELAPLPAGAQFLNVIESIFSGMSRAIIHNSDYPSLDAAQAAIDRYFAERNAYFLANPKCAGNTIWGKERVASEFHEGRNCKDPAYR
jgi:transposase